MINVNHNHLKSKDLFFEKAWRPHQQIREELLHVEFLLARINENRNRRRNQLLIAFFCMFSNPRKAQQDYVLQKTQHH